MRHRQHQFTPEPAWITEMTTLHNMLIDQGLVGGLSLMARTPGLRVDPADPTDVLRLALRFALTGGIPLSSTVGEVLDRLTAQDDRAALSTIVAPEAIQ